MNKLKREGGSVTPSPGRIPRGATKNEMNAASISIPSDWYDEKSCSAPMHERKSRVQSATINFGQTLKTRSTDAKIPATTMSVSIASDALIQRSVGAYQTRSREPS